jgi:soluble lytic murein transglycosylase
MNHPAMLKNMTDTNGRPQATALLSLCALSVLISFQLSQGVVSAPVPARKPAVAEQPKSGNFMDFSKALPFFTKSATRTTYEQASFTGHSVPGGDVALYKDIFKLQASGKMNEADKLVARLDDRSLMGHVLYQRYAHPSYKTSFIELKNWMDLYADQAGANRIYKMAQNRVPAGYKGNLKKPKESSIVAGGSDTLVAPAKVYKTPRIRTSAQESKARSAKSAIIALVMDGKMDSALQRLKDADSATFDSVEYDTIRGQIAAAYMYQGKMDRAYEIATAAVQRSGKGAPLAGWVAGMVSWQGKRYKESARFFEIAGNSPYSSGWMAAAGSYWAARSHMRLGNVKQVSAWLSKAGEHPRTFYGLIATRALGRDFDFNWHVPTFTKQYYDRLMSTPEGARAMALVAAGQPHRAESELMRVKVNDESMRNAILAYAGYADLPALAMRLGNAVSGSEGKIYDAALYPRTPWEPDEGYKVDPALINAIARQESRFDPGAKSSKGATGLMQIMPSTAAFVVRDLDDVSPDFELKDPQTNLNIAQIYIQTLLKDRAVQGDILKLLVAYNAGPGNLARWQKQWDEVSDPLMFIELIPSGQTRAYVERVLSNYWIYRLREDLPTPTLDALAAGKPALYAADFDERGTFRLASR